MPRAQSMDVINDSTTMTSRIDTMLLGVREDWDSSPEIKWNPGDPLYKHPSDRNAVYDEGNPEWGGAATVIGNNQCARRMVELFDDGERYEHMRCEECLVSWSGAEAKCWCCGQVRATVSSMRADQIYHGNYIRYMREMYRTPDDIRTAVRTQRRQHEFTVEIEYDIDLDRYRITGRYRGGHAVMVVETSEMARETGDEVRRQIIERLGGYLRVPADVIQAYGRIERQPDDPGPIYFNHDVETFGFRPDAAAAEDLVTYSNRDVELTRAWFTEVSSPQVVNVSNIDVHSWLRDEMRNLVREADDEFMRQALWGDGNPITYPRAIQRYEPPAPQGGIRAALMTMDEASARIERPSMAEALGFLAQPASIDELDRSDTIAIPSEIPTATPPMPEPLAVGEQFAQSVTYRPTVTRSPRVLP